jgi:hypothetical protein
MVINPSISKCVFIFCSQNLDALETFYSQINTNGSFHSSGVDLMLLFALIFIFILKYWFLFFLIRQNKEHNKKSIMVSKYAIHANNLKSNSLHEIKKEIIEAYNSKKKSEKKSKSEFISEKNIIEVSMIYNTQKMYNLMIDLIKSVKRMKIMKIKRQNKKDKIKQLTSKIDKLKKNILNLKTSKFMNEAFIIFDDQKIPQFLMSHKWERFYKKYFLNRLYFAQALEPIDIIWENFNNSEQKRVLKIFFSYLAALFILFRTFVYINITFS